MYIFFNQKKYNLAQESLEQIEFSSLLQTNQHQISNIIYFTTNLNLIWKTIAEKDAKSGNVFHSQFNSMDY